MVSRFWDVPSRSVPAKLSRPDRDASETKRYDKGSTGDARRDLLASGVPFEQAAQNSERATFKETPGNVICHRRTGAGRVNIFGTVSGDFLYLQLSIDDKDNFCQYFFG
jgi:hypothetical protein